MNMKNLIIRSVFLVGCIMFSGVALADETIKPTTSTTQCAPVKKRKPKVKPQIKSTVKKEQETQIVIINNNTNVNNNGEERVRVITRKVIVKEYVKENEHNNAINFLFGRSVTGLQAGQYSPSQVDAHTSGQVDAGLMYQRDIDRIRLSIGATINGGVYGGVGLRF
jgi:hypothetical protein